MEEDDELDGPSLLLRAMEERERERQYKEEESEKGNAKGTRTYMIVYFRRGSARLRWRVAIPYAIKSGTEALLEF